MKANELRIGNLILDSECEPYYFKVEEIRKYIGSELWVYYREGSIKAKNIEPIPLTEEWLVRFGFEKTFENPFIEYEWQYEWFTMDNELNPYLARYTNETDFKYVHQLQNLYFALTGNELELK